MPIFNFILSFFIEFGSLVGFLTFAYFFDFFTGVHVLIVCSVLSLLFSWMRDKRLPIFSIYTTSAILVFGSLSIYFQNPYLVVFEYTLYNLVFAAAAYIGYKKDKPIMKILFPTMFVMTDKGWHFMSIAWAILFVIAAVFNEFFWHYHDEQTWIIFRVFLIIFSTFFGMAQFLVSRKERLPGSSPWGLRQY